MWYRLAIKPNLPDNVFEQHVKEKTPKPIPVSDIWTGSGAQGKV
jgi:hypothetical protein